MLTYCLHHPNTDFLGQLLTNLLNGESEVLRVAVPRGSLVLSKGEARLFGEEVRCMVTTSKGATLLTNSAEFKEFDRTVQNCSVVEPTPALPIRQLANLCLDKYNRSGHMFALDVSLEGCTATIKPDKKSGLLFTFKRPNGELVRSNAWATSEVFDGQAALKAFSASVRTDAFEKEVIVKMGAVEIMREVSKYLGKTLVLFNTDPEGEYHGVGISSTGVCNFGKNSKGAPAAFTMAPSKLKVPCNCFLFAIDASVRDLVKGRPLFSLKEVGFQR